MRHTVKIETQKKKLRQTSNANKPTRGKKEIEKERKKNQTGINCLQQDVGRGTILTKELSPRQARKSEVVPSSVDKQQGYDVEVL